MAETKSDRTVRDNATDGADIAALTARLGDEFIRQFQRPLAGGLYVVATPIGNLGDISLRALATLARADAIYCEDKRVSAKLLSHFAIRRPLRSYHEHNGASARPAIMAELAAGKVLALICDAGTPLVSDPGHKLMRDAIEAGANVVALPGASALMAALVSAGLATHSLFFAGFLPPKHSARCKRLAGLQDVDATLIFFEAPQRLAAALDDIDAVLGARAAVVARELTKLHEEIKRGTPQELAEWTRTAAPRGEMVILIGPPGKTDIGDELISRRLGELLPKMSLRDAARAVAGELDLPKTRVYDLALALSNGGTGKRGEHP